MIELFKRLEKYGPGWGVYFRISEDNIITLYLEYLDRDKMKVYSDQHLLSKKMLDKMKNGDQETLFILDKMRRYIQKCIKKEMK